MSCHVDVVAVCNIPPRFTIFVPNTKHAPGPAATKTNRRSRQPHSTPQNNAYKWRKIWEYICICGTTIIALRICIMVPSLQCEREQLQVVTEVQHQVAHMPMVRIPLCHYIHAENADTHKHNAHKLSCGAVMGTHWHKSENGSCLLCRLASCCSRKLWWWCTLLDVVACCYVVGCCIFGIAVQLSCEKKPSFCSLLNIHHQRRCCHHHVMAPKPAGGLQQVEVGMAGMACTGVVCAYHHDMSLLGFLR